LLEEEWSLGRVRSRPHYQSHARRGRRNSSTWKSWLSFACFFLLVTVPAAGQSSELFISEYIEGSSNNKAIEIYNGTGAAINLTTGGCNIQMFFNGGAAAGLTINLTGPVAAGDVQVVPYSSANAEILAQADQTNGSGWFNGDDAVVLRKRTAVIDVIGQIGFDPGAEWGTGVTSTADNTLRRKSSVCAGDLNGSDPFDPAVQWDGFATDTFGGLGAHTAACAANHLIGITCGSAPTVAMGDQVDVNTDRSALTRCAAWANLK
jgi:uncharacterized protein